MRVRAWALSLGIAGLAVAMATAYGWRRDARADEQLAFRFSQRAVATPSTRIDCAVLRSPTPIVVLALGQSNAGNHGASSGLGPSIALITDRGECHRLFDPLPGATGSGASIWARLPEAMKAAGSSRPLVLAILAVDATTVEDWANANGLIARTLDQQLRRMRGAGLPPDLVLWQQGEADARIGTGADNYRARLRALTERLRKQGFAAPWLLAKSTVCRSAPSGPVRQAIDQVVQEDPALFAPGPDTDTLLAPQARSDGCHLSETGLTLAAVAWARAIAERIK